MNDQPFVSILEGPAAETAASTDIGNSRTLNEDSIAVVHPGGPGGDRGTLLLLADGLGGYNGGEVASTLVTARLPEFYCSGSGKDHIADLVDAVERCNTLVHEASRSADFRGMGTTLVAAVLLGDAVVFAHVGDSRGYLIRGGAVIHRTEDHSLNDAGTGAPGIKARSRYAHVLTRAIGPEPNVCIDVTAHRVAAGDRILLCSDGLTDCVGDEDIREIVEDHTPAEAARILVGKAKEQGGDDNISVVVARVHDIRLKRKAAGTPLAGIQPAPARGATPAGKPR